MAKKTTPFTPQKKPNEPNVFIKFDDNTCVGWDGRQKAIAWSAVLRIMLKHKNPPCLFRIDGAGMPSTTNYDSFRFHFFFFGQAAMACLFFTPYALLFYTLRLTP
ncbi:MAG: hypothetical protein K9M75_02090 [Phycisphaerae bacterium]|nr:hypothetical protein [Phycisphaerae bacterium]